MKRLFPAALFFLFLASGSVADELTPESTTVPVKIAPTSDNDTDEPAATSRVKLYMTDWCGYCRKTERLLEELDVSYEAIDIEKVPGARAEKQRHEPRCGVPVTVIAEQSVCGYSERKIRSLVKELKRSEASRDTEQGEA